ncbi:MAG: hypothetical protein ACFE9T_15940 [Promethearchaeota archaeon]
MQNIARVNSSIENIYNLCYSGEIPRHLTLINHVSTLVNQGINIRTHNEFGLFQFRLNSFKGFVEDLKNGIITSDLVSIVSIDLYNDMLEQAREFRRVNSEILNRAACVLARIVLEDGLKKICRKKGITPSSNSANAANMDLKRNNVYGNTQFKQVDTWLSFGNAAAHPENQNLDFSNVTQTQMDEMISNIPKFIDRYL